jgi:hypothetical protein
MLPPAFGLAVVVKVKVLGGVCVKVAVILLLADMVTDNGFVVPVASPLQPLKV